MPVMIKPKLGDVRYVVTWIDRDAMRRSDNSGDDLGEWLQQAERMRVFAADVAARTWAEENFSLNEYGAPRFEKQTFQRDDEDMPAEWMQSEHQEWSDYVWQPLVF
jgi:hypothetical protein